jgi:hypothetical protein
MSGPWDPGAGSPRTSHLQICYVHLYSTVMLRRLWETCRRGLRCAVELVGMSFCALCLVEAVVHFRLGGKPTKRLSDHFASPGCAFTNSMSVQSSAVDIFVVRSFRECDGWWLFSVFYTVGHSLDFRQLTRQLFNITSFVASDLFLFASCKPCLHSNYSINRSVTDVPQVISLFCVTIPPEMQCLSTVVCLFTIVLMGSGVAIPKERVVDRVSALLPSYDVLFCSAHIWSFLFGPEALKINMYVLSYEYKLSEYCTFKFIRNLDQNEYAFRFSFSKI